MNTNKQGFSLLELVIVVIIIGILLISIINLTSSIKTTKSVATISYIPKLKSSVDKLMNNQNIFSYQLLKEKLKQSNRNLTNVIMNNYFGGKQLMNGFNKPYTLKIIKNNKLEITTKLPDFTTCKKIKKAVINKNMASPSNVSCSNNGQIVIKYSDDN